MNSKPKPGDRVRILILNPDSRSKIFVVAAIRKSPKSLSGKCVLLVEDNVTKDPKDIEVVRIDYKCFGGYATPVRTRK